MYKLVALITLIASVMAQPQFSKQDRDTVTVIYATEGFDLDTSLDNINEALKANEIVVKSVAQGESDDEFTKVLVTLITEDEEGNKEQTDVKFRPVKNAVKISKLLRDLPDVLVV